MARWDFFNDTYSTSGFNSNLNCSLFWLVGGRICWRIFFIGREHAQAEYRNIEKNYAGKRLNMPWWGGFELKAWDLKSMLDWILPTIIGFVIAILATFMGWTI